MSQLPTIEIHHDQRELSLDEKACLVQPVTAEFDPHAKLTCYCGGQTARRYWSAARHGGSPGDVAASILLFGISHRSAPVSVLEQLSINESAQEKLIEGVLQSPGVSEAMVLSTCNRVEVYTVVDSVPGGLAAIGRVLSEHGEISLSDLSRYVYAHCNKAAVEHLFLVASGLDSAVMGEGQVLGQLRRAYAAAEANHTVGRVLHKLAQRALAVGKRVRSETTLGSAGASVVSVALGMANDRLAESGLKPGLAGKAAAVIGAGAMGALSAAHLTRAGIGHVYVVNRSLARGRRMVCKIRESGAGAEALTLDELPAALAAADVVVSCTGAPHPVISQADVHRAMMAAGPDHTAQPLVICDLGMPRDVDPAVATLPGVRVIDIECLRREPSAHADADAQAARRIVAGELESYLAEQRTAAVIPTVTALRRRAADVVEAELSLLKNRIPGVDAAPRDDVAHTVWRVVNKLLHTPTVRIKQLADTPGGISYAAALSELFELDQTATDVADDAGELLAVSKVRP